MKFQNKDRSYTLRNIDFTPLQVLDLLDLLHVGRSLDKVVASRDKQRLENGVRVDCIEAERLSGPEREICVDASTRAIVKETSKGPQGARTNRYGDFLEFGGRVYPRRLQLEKNGANEITANVVELKEDALDPKLLVPPLGAIERLECEGKTAPMVSTAPRPDFIPMNPPNDSTSIVELTVLEDGRVDGVHVIKSGGRDVDDVWIRAVKTARFKPAMCGAEPVVSETTLTMSVHHSLH